MKHRAKHTKQRGQILLITAMLLATAITVVLSVSFSANTETQITKLEEESQKALAAAESGVEIALQKKVASNQTNIENVGDYKASATVSDSTSLYQFVTPLLQPSNVYTFYLSDYKDSFSHPFQSPLYIYYKSTVDGDLCSDNSLEITLVYASNYKMKKFAVTKNPDTLQGPPNLTLSTTTPITIDKNTFQCRALLSLEEMEGSNFKYSDPKALFVRTLFKPTEIAFVSVNGTTVLPQQGVIVTSVATSETSGVTKRVRLFQSYPQIPVEFFVTRF